MSENCIRSSVQLRAAIWTACANAAIEHREARVGPVSQPSIEEARNIFKRATALDVEPRVAMKVNEDKQRGTYTLSVTPLE